MVESADRVVKTVGLTKMFRDFWYRKKVVAVDSLDLEIGSGEIYGLLGPNGSGKTTTLKMILSLLFPTRGRISIFGMDPSRREVKAAVGYLPEESHFYSFLDARETLDYYGKLFGLSRQTRRRRVEMLLDMVGLSGAAYRRTGEYSKGMKRRIGLAQALINDPELVILDEPTTGLDPMGTSLFKELMSSLADRGKTVILSSHLLADVEDVCNRICILYGGKKQAEGDTRQLLSEDRKTSIVTDLLDEDDVKRLEKVLRDSGKTLHSVSHPRDRLETLFLRVVQDAYGRKVESGGAQSGGRVAEFLQAASEDEQLIEELVKKSESATLPDTDTDKPPGTETEKKAEKADESFISELTSRKVEKAEETIPGSTKESRADIDESRHRDSNVDEEFIQNLVDRDSKNGSKGDDGV